MPTDTEKKFFITAFELLDQRQGTEWLRKYNNLMQTSDNGNKNILNSNFEHFNFV